MPKKPNLVPDPNTEPKPVVRKPSDKAKVVDRQEAITNIVRDVIGGLEQGSGKGFVISSARATVRTTMKVTEDGRWLLPNDVDRDSLEEVQVDIQFMPKEEA